MDTTTQSKHNAELEAIAAREAALTDKAEALWALQNEMTAAEALATMGERVSPARHILRHRQADAARKAFREALDAATKPEMDAFVALLTAHAKATR